ncbi:alpha/beta-hydrolase [Cristinia sonorae]|uniref:Alpha/beta-hydrolase n=1 Tax=Cristinia sonorae TaxID=1940300 RepID=A0A8K0UK25_9AGAR|nr:alpha/beta-hydrolase [Cristinia sonorae]
MIDHLLGRPSPSWKRLQVFLVIFFWVWRILYGNPGGPRLLWLRRANRMLQRFTPWQIIVSTLTGVYTVRNLDKILGLGCKHDSYSPSYYRATWIATGLDAGFATAMDIRPKWLKDICSILFSIYYIIYANEADEKLRKFRAVPTVEMLRTTWEKTSNPYIRAITILPSVNIRKKLVLPRPYDATYNRPVTAWLFFAGPEHHLSHATDLILDFPGGGFVSMTPEHHEERLRMWANRTGKPVLSIDYGKAPEYPYPFAIDECFDVYRTLADTAGKIIGMSGTKLNVILSGDSAGAHIAVSVMIKILETQIHLPRPTALVLSYAALDFNFTSWMSPSNLRVLQSEQSSGNIPGLAEQKDHFGHISPLSMVGDRKVIRRRRSWKDALRTLTSPTNEKLPPRLTPLSPVKRIRTSQSGIAHPPRRHTSGGLETGTLADEEDEADLDEIREKDRPLAARVRFNPIVSQTEVEKSAPVQAPANGSAAVEALPLGTRLTMTSRTGYFQDRIISPSMMRAMAILYIGPHRNPDFAHDYHLSPLLAPSELLAQFPPLMMSCGEKDPFVDDTVIFAGRVREAKRSRKRELDSLLSGPSVRLPEGLRMSMHETKDETTRSLRRERDQLAAQGDEDWVSLQIFSDWSHGYLQMPLLMAEARTVIYDMADWIDAAFAGHVGKSLPSPSLSTKRNVENSTPAVPNGHGSKGSGHHSEEEQTPFTSETEVTDTDDAITFVPKRRSPPTSFGSVPVKSRNRRLGPPSRESDSVGAETPPAKFPLNLPLPPEVYLASDDVTGYGGSDSTDLASPMVVDGGFGSIAGGPHGPQVHGLRTMAGSPPRVGTPGKAGPTITESELMRRRRLLDSHLIPNTSGDAVSPPT